MKANNRTVLERVGKRIDPEEITELARRFVSVPSYDAEYGWEAGVAQVLQEVLAAEGLPVQRQPVANVRANLLAMLPGDHGGVPLLMLNGHMDTVPPSSSMTHPPFAAEIWDGRLWGRGSADMKGGLAAMTLALVALRRAGVRLPRPVVLAAVVAEETGNLGTGALTHAGPPASFAVVGEPMSLAVITAHKGVDRYRITVHGRAAHGGTPERGINAIVQAARVILAVDEQLARSWKRATHPLLGSPTYNIGTIRGGLSRNTVPDRCTFQLEKRWIPGDSPTRIRADLETIIARAAGPGQAEVVHEPEFETIVHPPLDIPTDHLLVRTLATALEEVSGRPATVTSFPAFTDAAILQAAGTPAVVCGPGALATAHSDDEHVLIAELQAAAYAYVSLALRLSDAEQRRKDGGA